MPIRDWDRALIFFAVLVVLCNYYYFYFVDFYQGAVDVGLIFSAFKLVGIFLICLFLLRFSFREIYCWELLGFLAFFVLASAVYFLKGLALGFVDRMFLNTVICVVPFFLFRLRAERERVKFFFECCLVVLIAQIFLDQIIFLSGKSLWENNAFVGGVGNPSSFGLLCNILLCYVLFERKPSFVSAVFCLVISYGVCRSNSLLALISLFFVFMAYLCEGFSFKRLLFVFAVLFFSISLGEGNHLLYKLDSALHVLAEDNEVRGSISVSSRLQIIAEYAENLIENPVQALLYGFEYKNYMGYDSQVLTYLSSFGVFISLLFFLSFAGLLFFCWWARVGYFFCVTLLLFGMNFLTNRILDYYPIPLFFAILVVLLGESLSDKKYFRMSRLSIFRMFFTESGRLSS